MLDDLLFKIIWRGEYKDEGKFKGKLLLGIGKDIGGNCEYGLGMCLLLDNIFGN